MIYLDNAATTLIKPQSVVEAVASSLCRMGNSSRGAYEQALTASAVIFETREALSALFGGAGAEQVVFTANSTEALNTALTGLLHPKDHVITTDLEHNSVLRPLYRLEDEGVTLSFVHADSRGKICYEEFERLVNERTRAIVCTHASNLTGNMLDLERIGAIAAKHRLLFIADASQTAGVFPIDMEKMHIDVLCFTGHKSLLGPQGTGGMVIRPGLSIRPLKVGGSGILSFDREHPRFLPTALEAGTQNGPGIAGLGAGVRFIRETGMDRIRAHELQLAAAFYRAVAELAGVFVYGDFSGIENGAQWAHAPIVSLNIRDYDSAEVGDELARQYGIAVRSGAHCAPRMHQALGTQQRGAVRFSFSWFNTMEEVRQAALAVRTIAQESE